MDSAARAKVTDIINAAADMTVATVRPDGFPQATTVSFVNDGDKIYFGCWSQSQKAQNISHNDKVSVALHNNTRDWDKIKGLSMGGHALRVSDKAELARVFDLMMKKFPQIEQFTVGDDVEMAVFRIAPVAISVLDYQQGFGHTESIPVTA